MRSECTGSSRPNCQILQNVIYDTLKRQPKQTMTPGPNTANAQRCGQNWIDINHMLGTLVVCNTGMYHYVVPTCASTIERIRMFTFSHENQESDGAVPLHRLEDGIGSAGTRAGADRVVSIGSCHVLLVMAASTASNSTRTEGAVPYRR